MNYGPPHDPLADLAHTRHGAIAAYARGADYHGLMQRRLKALAAWVASEWDAEARVFLDTAPALEKPLAQAAGLGWQGKHTNLISRELGSWLLLGEVFTALDLATDVAGRRCMRDVFAVPRGVPDGRVSAVLPARRAALYLVPHHRAQGAHRGRVPGGDRNRIYGCDDCLAVCPWNKYARLAAEAALRPRLDLAAPELADLAALDDESFRRVFSGSALKRTGRNRFVRNVLIAIGNARDPALLPAVRGLLGDVLPLVRAMAAWVLGCIDPLSFERERAARAGREDDADVRAEWARAGGSGGGPGHYNDRDGRGARP